jgi:hypothetical protein
VRAEHHPTPDASFASYEARAHACAPLTSGYFRADAQRVHQIIKAHTQGESAKEWIRDIDHLHDGRKDILALKAHFQGEGNASRRIAEADSLRDNLHYKSKRSFKYQSFLDKIQFMFTIYRDEVRSTLKKLRYDAYLIRSVIVTYKQPSTPFDSINSRMVQAAHELLTSLQVRSVAYLKHSHTTGIAIPLNSALKNLGAEVEGEARDEEEDAVDEEEDAAAEEAIKSTPVTARTGMTFHLSNDRSS